MTPAAAGSRHAVELVDGSDHIAEAEEVDSDEVGQTADLAGALPSPVDDEVPRVDNRRIGSVGQQIDVSEEWVGFFVRKLRTFLPDVPEERLTSMSRYMVWIADGMVEGMSNWPKLSREELHQGLLAAFRGVVAR